MGLESRKAHFEAQLAPYWRPLALHCYRMLGSLQDAEEVAQETMLRAWQRIGEVRASESIRAWLYKIATNACLDALRVRRRRSLPHLVRRARTMGDGAPPHEERWIDPAPDAWFEAEDAEDEREPGPERRTLVRENIGLAFIAALQWLPPKQRATLILSDVLGWRPLEIAELLETTIVSVYSLLQRARKGIESHAPHDIASEMTTADEEALLQRYIGAWECGDLDAFTALLAEDAILSMPPLAEWYSGKEAIHRFLTHVLATEPSRYRLIPLRANHAHAVAVFRQKTAGDPYEAAAMTVLAMRRGRIARMIRFASPNLFSYFDLSESPRSARPSQAART
ncbi:RNA polymerase subunit sigma-70 [Pendulispora albinea]|uniref:RNA polymerase sigma factor n=2 Tax=Pendulispora albinea TaxID=2741071 RepID=A0ABZ2M1V3_9BACT